MNRKGYVSEAFFELMWPPVLILTVIVIIAMTITIVSNYSTSIDVESWNNKLKARDKWVSEYIGKPVRWTGDKYVIVVPEKVQEVVE